MSLEHLLLSRHPSQNFSDVPLLYPPYIACRNSAYRSFTSGLFKKFLCSPVDPSFRALSGRVKFMVRLHKFNKDYLLYSKSSRTTTLQCNHSFLKVGLVPGSEPLLSTLEYVHFEGSLSILEYVHFRGPLSTLDLPTLKGLCQLWICPLWRASYQGRSRDFTLSDSRHLLRSACCQKWTREVNFAETERREKFTCRDFTREQTSAHLNVGLWDLYEPPGAFGHAVSNIRVCVTERGRSV